MLTQSGRTRLYPPTVLDIADIEMLTRAVSADSLGQPGLYWAVPADSLRQSWTVLTQSCRTRLYSLTVLDSHGQRKESAVTVPSAAEGRELGKTSNAKPRRDVLDSCQDVLDIFKSVEYCARLLPSCGGRL